jgi:hypothetical protein
MLDWKDYLAMSTQNVVLMCFMAATGFGIPPLLVVPKLLCRFHFAH